MDLQNKKENSNNKNQNTKILLAFLSGLLIGAIITPLTLDRTIPAADLEEGLAEDSIVADSEDVNINSIGKTDVMVNVNDQIAGSVVAIEQVISSNAGWVVIRKNAYGTPGTVLGAKHFDAGLVGGTVNLLRNTRIGNIYYAVLYNDNGDGIFNVREDQPMVDSADNVIADTFVTIPLTQ